MLLFNLQVSGLKSGWCERSSCVLSPGLGSSGVTRGVNEIQDMVTEQDPKKGTRN